MFHLKDNRNYSNTKRVIIQVHIETGNVPTHISTVYLSKNA